MPEQLTFSAMLVLLGTGVTVFMLAVQRWFVGGELGGHRATRFFVAAILLALWIVFIFLVSFQVRGAQEPLCLCQQSVLV